MPDLKIRQLDPGYSAEVDAIGEPGWNELLGEFSDANIYQTWAYAAIIAGERKVSHLVLRRNGAIAAAAQIRIAKVPLLPAGIAYVHWGPVFRRDGSAENVETFRQTLRALRNEFVCKRGLVLRLFPMLSDADSPLFSAAMAEEGYAGVASMARGRTILRDLRPQLDALRAGMNAHWRRELKVAEKRGLELIEGTSDELFGSLISTYKEMVKRKKFVEPNDINQFRRIQKRLPEQFRMKIMLCKGGDEVSSGLIASAIGNTAIYLFGATSNNGLKSRGSYFLQWRYLESLRGTPVEVYNLNGINPDKNPGTYKFKNDLAGENAKDVYYLGRFDARGGWLSNSLVTIAEKLRGLRRRMRQPAKVEQRPTVTAPPAEQAAALTYSRQGETIDQSLQ
jgi:lipid II:glycine glycyltransferase (peptidoglycan interpeptide bridge formation enzyme)